MSGVEQRIYNPSSPALSPSTTQELHRNHAIQVGEHSASFNYHTTILTELSAPPLLGILKETIQTTPVKWDKANKQRAKKLHRSFKYEFNTVCGSIFEAHVIDVANNVASKYAPFIETNPFFFDLDSEAVTFSYDKKTGNLIGNRNCYVEFNTNSWEYDKVMYICDPDGRWRVLILEAKLDANYQNGYIEKAMSPRYINNKIGPLLHLKSDHPDEIAGFTYLLATTRDNVDVNNKPRQQKLVDIYKGNIVGTSFTGIQFVQDVRSILAI